MSGRSQSPTPNDPLDGSLCGLHNTGQSARTSGAVIDVAAAWDVFTGSRNVMVAVIDEGIDFSHVDLDANRLSNPRRIAVLVAAGVKNWALVASHGYVGYLPEPRATQDVDVMVPFGQRKRAAKAIREAWPGLVELELSQAVRFMDPDDLHPNGQPKPVIDLMLPWGEFQATILKDYVVTDEETQHRIPRLEAALASKYAALVSAFFSCEAGSHAWRRTPQRGRRLLGTMGTVGGPCGNEWPAGPVAQPGHRKRRPVRE